MSLCRNAQLLQGLRVPGLILGGEDVQSELIGVNAINEVAKYAAYPVGRVTEAGPLLHDAPTVPHVGLLVDSLDVSHIKLESLGALATEDQHISVANLDA